MIGDLFIMEIKKTIELLESDRIKTLFSKVYGSNAKTISSQITRYKDLIAHYKEEFEEADIEMFSSPGRTEIGGNHTDHNHGKVLTASINLDCIGIACKNEKNLIHIKDITYNENFIIDANKLNKIEGEKGAIALVKGILNGFKEFGYNIGGFNACITSDVISAAGVSSSASFEMLICSIINLFFNDGNIDKVTCARIGQYAENKYWDKQSGLLDQMACAFGGMISIDFKDPKKPVIENIEFDFDKENYDLIIVNTGKNHADLSDEYSSIPIEMKSVANYFNKQFLREISKEDILNNIDSLREKVGDRPILRALHFFEENNRVDEQVKALKNGNFQMFLNLIIESGDSSWKWLQNCYSISNYEEQSISIALALTNLYLKKNKKAAYRIHGGGFAGVIMTLIPHETANGYIEFMKKHIGDDAVYNMNIRKYGAEHLNELI
jgi:galactokinase